MENKEREIFNLLKQKAVRYSKVEALLYFAEQVIYWQKSKDFWERKLSLKNTLASNKEIYENIARANTWLESSKKMLDSKIREIG